jgi:hypothetical protein
LGSAAAGTVQGLSQMAMGLSAIKGLFDTLNNEDLTAFEKSL